MEQVLVCVTDEPLWQGSGMSYMTKKLFICLTAFSQTGGIEKFNRCFAKALMENESGQNVLMHSLYDSEAMEAYIPSGFFRGFLGNKWWFIIKTFFSARKYDVIITGHLNVALLPWFIKKIYPSKKQVVICHGIEIFDAAVKGFKLKLLQQADVLLAVSNYTKEALEKMPGIRKDKITVFPNTIDPLFKEPVSFEKPVHLKERYQIYNGSPVLFTLTRLSSKEKYKGHDKVIGSLEKVNKVFPGVKYIIGGKADEQELKATQHLIKEKGLTDVVSMTGYIADEELTEHFMLSDVFVMPSKKEGFGIVFLEAACCGLTVVAGNKDGSRDALMNGELGILVDPDDEEAIAEGIIKALQQSKSQNKKAIQQKVNDEFGFHKFKQRLSTVLSKI